jgi:hypothetical protein
MHTATLRRDAVRLRGSIGLSVLQFASPSPPRLGHDASEDWSACARACTIALLNRVIFLLLRIRSWIPAIILGLSSVQDEAPAMHTPRHIILSTTIILGLSAQGTSDVPNSFPHAWPGQPKGNFSPAWQNCEFTPCLQGIAHILNGCSQTLK